MIKHAWSILCDRVVNDKISNNLTLSAIEQIVFQYEPQGEIPVSDILIPVQGTIVSLWYKNAEDTEDSVKIRVQIKNFENRQIGGVEVELAFKGMMRARAILQFGNLPVPPAGSGYFVFVVEHMLKEKWKKVAEVPLWVDVSQKTVDTAMKSTSH